MQLTDEQKHLADRVENFTCQRLGLPQAGPFPDGSDPRDLDVPQRRRFLIEASIIYLAGDMSGLWSARSVPFNSIDGIGDFLEVALSRLEEEGAVDSLDANQRMQDLVELIP